MPHNKNANQPSSSSTPHFLQFLTHFFTGSDAAEAQSYCYLFYPVLGIGEQYGQKDLECYLYIKPEVEPVRKNVIVKYHEANAQQVLKLLRDKQCKRINLMGLFGGDDNKWITNERFDDLKNIFQKISLETLLLKLNSCADQNIENQLRELITSLKSLKTIELEISNASNNDVTLWLEALLATSRIEKIVLNNKSMYFEVDHLHQPAALKIRSCDGGAQLTRAIITKNNQQRQVILSTIAKFKPLTNVYFHGINLLDANLILNVLNNSNAKINALRIESTSVPSDFLNSITAAVLNNNTINRFAFFPKHLTEAERKNVAAGWQHLGIQLPISNNTSLSTVLGYPDPPIEIEEAKFYTALTPQARAERKSNTCLKLR